MFSSLFVRTARRIWIGRLQVFAAVAVAMLPVWAFADLKWDVRELNLTAAAGADSVVGEYPFTNTGKETVTFTSVNSSCDCTTVSLEKKTYAPGEGGKITATFKPGTRQGLQRKNILAQLEGQAEKQVILLLKVQLPEVAALDTTALRWKVGEAASTKSVQVRIPAGATMKVRGLAAVEPTTQPKSNGLRRIAPDNFQAMVRTVSDGQEYVVDVTPRSTAQATSAAFSLVTDSSDPRVSSIRIFAQVSRPVLLGVSATQPSGATTQPSR